MEYLTCPGCDADLNPQVLIDRNSTDCPFCEHDVRALLPAEEHETDSGTNAAFPLDELPPDSKIRCAESSDERVVLILPRGGSHASGMGCFSAAWLGFMVVFTGAFVGGGGLNDAPWFLLPFLGLFWSIGLGMAGFWARMRFTRTYVLIERGRMVIQKLLFGRRAGDEITFDDSSAATMVTAYEMNDMPVHRVEVAGAGGAVLKFATRLSTEEKIWLCNSLNQFLGNDGSTTIASLLGVARVVSVEDPSATANDSVHKPESLELLEDNDNRLRFEVPSLPFPPSPAIAVFSGMLGLIWLLMLVGHARMLPIGEGPGIVHLLFLIPFAFTGVVMLLMPVFLYRGRVAVEVTAQRIRCRYLVGPLGFSRKMPVELIEDIVGREFGMPARGSTESNAVPFLCMAVAPERPLILALVRTEDHARYVVGMIKRWLENAGVTFANG